MRFVDRTGIKYGKLTAIKYMGKSKWLCKCDCGNEKIVYGGHLAQDIQNLVDVHTRLETIWWERVLVI